MIQALPKSKTPILDWTAPANLKPYCNRCARSVTTYIFYPEPKPIDRLDVSGMKKNKQFWIAEGF
jgi:hypothetical protein